MHFSVNILKKKHTTILNKVWCWMFKKRLFFEGCATLQMAPQTCTILNEDEWKLKRCAAGDWSHTQPWSDHRYQRDKEKSSSYLILSNGFIINRKWTFYTTLHQSKEIHDNIVSVHSYDNNNKNNNNNIFCFNPKVTKLSSSSLLHFII